MALSGLSCGDFMRQKWRLYGSWPKFVKRGGLEVLPYFPAHGREGEAAPLLRRNLLILLVQVAILMVSRSLAKNRGWFLAKVRETGWFGGFALFSRTRAGRRGRAIIEEKPPHSPRPGCHPYGITIFGQEPKICRACHKGLPQIR